TKPVGSFYTSAEAQRYMVERGEVWIEDSGRGWRKVVPSPQPRKIVEEKMIRELADRYLVIAAGGGGIPVIRKEGLYRGVEAVIDKDLAAQLLAKAVNSEVLIILTDVSHVALNFGQPDEKQLGRVTIDELQHYEQEGHFASGSMGPKVRAAINFVREGGERAIITSLDCVVEAVNGDTGTQVFYNRLSAYGTDYRLIS
ncbi:MAG: carbamate kinase, partial [Firmicutes bacterium]|nr:carbamate kinase [Bacillota bacterium]